MGGRVGVNAMRGKSADRATVEGLSASLDPANAPMVRRRRRNCPPDVTHGRVTFNRSNGKFGCQCGRVHGWGWATDHHGSCRALQCWCGWWHIRRDSEFEPRRKS